MVTEATAVIGDVHGDFRELVSLLRRIPDRKLVFVGDLANRGPESRAVLDLVADLQGAGRALLVRGNHEASVLAFWRGELSFVDFALMGGLPTLKSYLDGVQGDVRGAFREAFPSRHRVLLEHARAEIVIGTALVTHWDEEAEEALRTGVGRSSRGRPLIVGHTVVEHAERIGDIVFLDSGCGTGGALSAFLLPEETFISTADDDAD